MDIFQKPVRKKKGVEKMNKLFYYNGIISVFRKCKEQLIIYILILILISGFVFIVRS